MLSGIRTGKKKKKTTPATTTTTTTTTTTAVVVNTKPLDDDDHNNSSNATITHSDNSPDRKKQFTTTTTTTTTTSKVNNNNGSKNDNDANLSAAEKIRQALATGTPLYDLPTTTTKAKVSSSSSSVSHFDRITSDLTTMNRRPLSSEHHHDENDHENFIVLDSPPLMGGHVGKGATTTTSSSSWGNKREEDMSMIELAAKERATSSSSAGGGNNGSSTMMSWDEHMARDIIRVGKKRKVKAGGRNNNEDSDDEVERMKRHLPDYHDDNESDRKAAKKLDKANQRDQRRRIDQYQKQEKITSMCGWWINSSSFTKHRLLAFGRHVSLMMAPPNASLVPGNQFYLVPLKHATSFVDCDDDGGVWEEVAMFRSSLENVFARERKGIIFIETVLPTNSSKGFWQTKIEVIPVPFTVLQDAPMYFKSAMIEQAEDFGTHNKLMATTVQKPLRNIVPKRFPYFAVDWGNISTSNNTGFAQIIESSTFRHDFGLDTIAGMMGLDPIRFQRKSKFSNDIEGKWINEFVHKWKPFDWTEKLD